VRVVVATNQDLWQKVKEGTFREDLFYRLDVVPISLPPLRERREEIPHLAQHFLNRKAREHGLYPKALHPSVDPLLCALPWPGNVRQLENGIERAIILSAARAVLTREDFLFLLDRVSESEAIVSSLPPAPLFAEPSSSAGGIEPGYDLPPDGMDLNQAVAEMEKKFILQALGVTRGNKKRAAELLDLKRTTLLEKIKRLEIKVQDEDGGTEAE
jgi:sigma-54 specific flagellar transcriptional regulator A